MLNLKEKLEKKLQEKKENNYIKFFFFFLFILFFIPFSNSQITGESITGKQTSESLFIEIGIEIPEIIFNLISPKNGTYLTKNIDILFEEANAEEIILSINKSNMSISQPTSILLEEGNYLLEFFIKKDYETIKTIRNIIINPDLLTIHYKTFTKQKTTDFYKFTIEELSKLSNIELENSSFGKIKFLEKINLTEDNNPNDKIVNLDSNLEIKDKEIIFNQNELPNFKKKCLIYFYNINYENPLILKNNIKCSQPECIIKEYKNNTLGIEVTELSNYKIIETVEKTNPNPSSGRGSSGSETNEEEKIEIKIETEELILNLKQGDYKKRIITITNNKDEIVSINIEQKGLENFLEIKETEIKIPPKQSYQLILEFKIDENTKENIYLGELKIKQKNYEKEIWIVLNIESKNSLFDVYLTILNENQDHQRGQSLYIRSEIFNLGETESVDAILNYELKNKNGETIYSMEKTTAIRTKVELFERINLPNDIKAGEYLISLTVLYDNQIAIASESFVVKTKINYLLILNILLILGMILILIIKKKRNKKRKKKNHKSKRSKSRGK